MNADLKRNFFIQLIGRENGEDDSGNTYTKNWKVDDGVEGIEGL